MRQGDGGSRRRLAGRISGPPGRHGLSDRSATSTPSRLVSLHLHAVDADRPDEIVEEDAPLRRRVGVRPPRPQLGAISRRRAVTSGHERSNGASSFRNRRRLTRRPRRGRHAPQQLTPPFRDRRRLTRRPRRGRHAPQQLTPLVPRSTTPHSTSASWTSRPAAAHAPVPRSTTPHSTPTSWTSTPLNASGRDSCPRHRLRKSSS